MAMLLLLLLSRFSHVRLCATPEMAVHQAPPSLGFSRQEHWSGLPFPPPMHESEKWKWSLAQSCPTPRDPMDCSRPGSSIHGILQARVLEWGAIAFSDNMAIATSKTGLTVSASLLLAWSQLPEILTLTFNSACLLICSYILTSLDSFEE